MATARPRVQLTDWLKLVEVSGPFLSEGALRSAFAQGLPKPADEPQVRAVLGAAMDEWQDLASDAAYHRAWVLHVLREVLGHGREVLVDGNTRPDLAFRFAEHGETLAPTWASVTPQGAVDAGKARLLVALYPDRTGLEKSLRGHRWPASPVTRMIELLRATGVRLGLCTNGEDWALVHAPRGETSTTVTFQASLWIEEPAALRAFRALLGAPRFYGEAPATTLEGLLDASRNDQAEVTDQLGLQVRHAVEVLVQSIDRIDRDQGRTLLRGIADRTLYESAVTLMMRLVFLFAAEERRLLPLDNPTYARNYALSTLREQLHEVADQKGEEVLERRFDAFSRLLALFRAIHGGASHQDLLIPAHGGSLFDPDRFPFLEGREAGTSWRTTAARSLPIHDRTVLHLLDALQVLRFRHQETRRLSFRALGVEQIGHVYEGLLDQTAVRAKGSPVLGLLGSQGNEPELPLTALEKLLAEGEPALLAHLREHTGRSEKKLAEELRFPALEDETRLQVACDNRPALAARVRPFARLLRLDTFDYPFVVDEGGIYVTDGQDRRSSGTHYTPPSLTEPVVRYTLEPLCYEGPAAGLPPERWVLRAPEQLLALRVCDPAMGSGAFLVQACRYLAARLTEAWKIAEEREPGVLLRIPAATASEGSPAEQLLPLDDEERLRLARRLVADRCLHGVDLNPMAVEMAKLSLWLETLQQNRPFTFLDHSLRAGDSLLGLSHQKQLEVFHLDSTRLGTTLPIGADRFRQALALAIDLRRQLTSFSVFTAADVERKRALLSRVDAALLEARLLADCLVGVTLTTAGSSGTAADRAIASLAASLTFALARPEPLAALQAAVPAAARLASRLAPPDPAARRPFHWPLEFPEIMQAGGFDAILGNPPFMGGQKLTGNFGTDYRSWLVAHLAGGQTGSADLSAYFVLRINGLLQAAGSAGIVSTNTIAQGDTREVGLDAMVAGGTTITRAIPSMPWPGVANLEVALLWLHKGTWTGPLVLAGKPVSGITSQLTETGGVTGKPFKLVANEGKSFQGSIVLGMGFVMEPEEAASLIAKNPKNKDVLFPYLGGEDLNKQPNQVAPRWVINFHDWPLDHESAPAGYTGSVAADYPEILAIVRAKVKPERDKNNRAQRREKWWQYAERAPALYKAIAGMERVLAVSLVSNHVSFGLVLTGQVLSHKLAVFGLGDYSSLALLQSHLHYHWAWHHSSTMRVDLNYSPSDCFETFPFPLSTAGLEDIGERYHEHRKQVMLATGLGLTKTYNRFHDPAEKSPDIVKLRALHVEMDRAVAGAYGWEMDLGHGFHQTKQGMRYTLSEEARREVLDRLLALNHARYAEEVAAGLHQGKRARGGAAEGAAEGGGVGGQRGRVGNPPLHTSGGVGGDGRGGVAGASSGNGAGDGRGGGGNAGAPGTGTRARARRVAETPAGESAQLSLLGASTPRPAAVVAAGDEEARLMAALRGAERALGKTEWLAAAGVEATAGDRAIKKLKDQGAVSSEGAGRGTKYRPARD